MHELQTYASQGGFWFFMAVFAVGAIGAAIHFRGHVEGDMGLKGYFQFVICVAIAIGVYWMLTGMVQPH